MLVGLDESLGIGVLVSCLLHLEDFGNRQWFIELLTGSGRKLFAELLKVPLSYW